MDLTPKKQKEREVVLEKIKKFENSFWAFLIKKNRLTYLIVVFLFLFGTLTLEELPKELNPEVEIPYAIITTVYPGASPLNVEQQITKEIEAEISGLSGIKRIDSTSSESISTISVEFEADEDLDDSIRNLKDEVDGVKSKLPEDAEDPIVSEISFADEAIFTAVLAGEQDVSQLKIYAENLENKLESIAYVSEVKVIGGRDRVYKVDVDPEKASRKGLSVNGIKTVLAANHLDFPAGNIEVDNLSYNVRIEGELETVDDLAKIPVGSQNGAPILLEDVATVTNGFAEETSRSRFAFGGQESIDAVTLQLFKKTGGDVTRVAERAREITEAGRGVDYPENLRVEITQDQSVYITDSIGSLMNNGLGTVVIVFALLFFFLGMREALIAGLSIPFSFFIAFIAMAVIGESLNFLSLFSLVLALGLLVDSAIVIVEGMYRKIAQLRLSGYQAAIAVVEEHSSALLSGLLTTVSVFVPLMFLIGIMGQFMRTIPVVVNITLISSLFVSLSIIPAVGALALNPRGKHALKKNEKEKHECCTKIRKIWLALKARFASKARTERLANKFFQALSDRYYAFLPKVISTKRSRRIWIGGTLALFAFSILLVATGFLKIAAFTETDSEYMTINIEMPQGLQIEETDKIVRRVEEIIKKEKEITNYTSSVGSSSGSSSSGENKAFIYVNLTETEDRDISSTEIIQNLNQELEKDVTEAKFSFAQEESGPPSGSDIEARVVGDDLLVLGDVAEEIKLQLEQIPTVVSADTSVDLSPGEIVFVPNQDLIADRGLTVSSIGLELNKGISRDDSLEVEVDGDEIAIDLGYDKKHLKTIESVGDILITASSGQTYSLSELGEIKLQASLSNIKRRDEERVVSVTADSQGGNVAEINEELQKRIDENVEIPEGYRVDFGGENEDTMETFQDMFVKMIIGIVLMLFVLITQFNSYRQVAIILFTIPLAMIGVFIGMGIARLTLDLPAFIGIISLVGIIVNNAIILIDQINKELEKGKVLVEATRKAGYSRMRPIILTSITTIMGLLPLSITEPVWRNMGFTIIFGLAFGTILTLFIVPAMMVSFYQKDVK